MVANRNLLCFEHAPTLEAAAEEFVSGSSTGIVVLGPVESGKSVLGIALMYVMGCCIPRCVDGIRRARILIVRSTEAELDRGIKKSINNWFDPDVFGQFKGSMPSTLTLRILDMELELEMFAFEDDSEKVLKKLRSTEYTMAFINEAQYMTLRLVKAIEQRTGRYPPPHLCPDYDRQRRIFCDMNMPSDDLHWALVMSGKSVLPNDMDPKERLKFTKPKKWKFFTQPPSVEPIKDFRGQITGFKVNPDAENLPYTTEEGILQLTEGADVDDVLRDMACQVVPKRSGVPRYKKFSMRWHVSRDPLEIFDDAPLYCGHDPGLFGGWVFGQLINGQWRMLFEYKAENETTAEQAENVKHILSEKAPFWQRTGMIAYGDPFGNRAQTAAAGTERTAYDVLRTQGIYVQTPALKDDPEARLTIGREVLRQSIGEGAPKVIFDAGGCPQLIAALNGGMTMKVVGGGAGKYGEVKMQVDKKSGHADIGEAWEYLMWGGGESKGVVINAMGQDQPIQVTPKRGIYGGPRRMGTGQRRGGFRK